MPSQSGEVPSTTSLQRSLAVRSSTSHGIRWPSIRTIAVSDSSDGEEGASRISLERMSPIEGPPRQRRISEDEPPSSEMGRIKEVEGPKAEQIALPPDPPEIQTTETAPRS